MTPFVRDREATTAGPSTDCAIFAWVGQSFACCDECGLPSRSHPYRPTYGGQSPTLYVKHYERFVKRWFWRPVRLNEFYVAPTP